MDSKKVNGSANGSNTADDWADEKVQDREEKYNGREETKWKR